MPAVDPELAGRDPAGSRRLQRHRQARPVLGVDGRDQVERAGLVRSVGSDRAVLGGVAQQSFHGRAEEVGSARAVGHQDQVGGLVDERPVARLALSLGPTACSLVEACERQQQHGGQGRRHDCGPDTSGPSSSLDGGDDDHGPGVLVVLLGGDLGHGHPVAVDGGGGTGAGLADQRAESRRPLAAEGGGADHRLVAVEQDLSGVVVHDQVGEPGGDAVRAGSEGVQDDLEVRHPPRPARGRDQGGGVGDDPLVGVRGDVRGGLVDVTLGQLHGRREEGGLRLLGRQLGGRGDLASDDPGPLGSRVVDQARLADLPGIELLQVCHRLGCLRRGGSDLRGRQLIASLLELGQGRVVGQQQLDALRPLEVLLECARAQDRIRAERVVELGERRVTACRGGAEDRPREQDDTQRRRDEAQQAPAEPCVVARHPGAGDIQHPPHRRHRWCLLSLLEHIDPSLLHTIVVTWALTDTSTQDSPHPHVNACHRPFRPSCQGVRAKPVADSGSDGRRPRGELPLP